MSVVRPPHSPRPLLAALAALVVLPVMGWPTGAVADDAVATGDTVVGELVQAWAEHENPAEAVERAEEGPLSWIETDAGEAVRISTEDLAGLVGNADGEAPVGATVEVVVGEEIADSATTEEGVEPAHEVLAAEVLEAAPEEKPLAAGVTNEVTVVMMYPPGGAPEPDRTLQQVLAAVNGPVAAFWSSQTGGAVTVATAAQNVDWVESTVPCSNYTGIWNEAATHANWTPGRPGKHLMVYLPYGTPGCSYGLAQVGAGPGSGGRLYVTDVVTSVIAHELGHNFSLGHSFGRQCDAGAESGNCQDTEYRDYYDVMGVSAPWLGSLSPPHAARLNVLPAGRVRALSTPADTVVQTLVPYGAPSGTAGTRVLKLTASDGALYWLEYRTATGQDAWLASGSNSYGLQQGVLLRRSMPGGNTTLLLDPTPEVPQDDDWSEALPVGTPVRLSGKDFTVTVQSAGAAGAVVQVVSVEGDPACGRGTSVPTAGVSLTTVDGAPTAVVVGTDRGLWLRPVDGTQASWRSLGGAVRYGPAGADDGTTAHVFATGLDGSLYHRASSGSGWTPWEALGGQLTSSPSAASLGAGHVRVFGRGGDGQLWSRELEGGHWSAWVSLGGLLTASPSATADRAAQRIEVAVRGTDGLFYEQSLAVGEPTGTYVRRNVMACSALVRGGVRDVGDPAGAAFVDSLGTPRLLADDGSRSVGGAVTTTPAVAFPDGDVLLLGRGLNGTLWLYDSRGTSPVWRSLGGIVL